MSAAGATPGGAPAPAGADLLLEVRGLVAGYGPIEALHGVDVALGRGQLVALVGANGAGKTTLLRTISGLVRARAGIVRLAGEDVTHAPPDRRVRAGLAQVLEGRQVFGPLSVEDNLLLGGYVRGREARSSLEEMYALFPVLQERRHAAAGALSGGQQQMLAIARALMSRPRLLLLDEPSMGLAPRLVREILDVIVRLRDRGVPILLVEQNARAALAIADHGYVIETGRVRFGGPARDLLRDERVQAAYLGAVAAP